MAAKKSFNSGSGIGTLLVLILVLLVSVSLTACGGGGDSPASASDSGNNGSNGNGNSGSDSSPALLWTGSAWQTVDWNQVTAGLSDLDKLVITSQAYEKAGTTYYRAHSTGRDSAGNSLDDFQVSTDNGATWTTLFNKSNLSSITANGSDLYTTNWRFSPYSAYPSSEVWQSRNGGADWTEVRSNGMYDIWTSCAYKSDFFYAYADRLENFTDDVTTTVPTGSMSITRIEATDSAIYALSNKNVFESLDGGENWTKIGSDMKDIAVFNSQLYVFQ